MSIGLRSVIDSSLLLLVTFVFIIVLSMLLESGKGGGGGGVGMFVLVTVGTGSGGGGGGGRVGANVTVGANVIVGGGGLDGKVLCTSGILDEVFRGALWDILDGTFGNAEDGLKRFGGKGGALRVWILNVFGCWNTECFYYYIQNGPL